MIFFFWFLENLSYAGLSILQMRKLRTRVGTRVGELRVQSHTGNPGGAVSPGVIPRFFHIPRSPIPIPTTASLVSDNGPGALTVLTPQKAELLPHHYPFLSCLSTNPQPQTGWKL